MSMITRNLTFANYVNVREHCHYYQPNILPSNENRTCAKETVFKQNVEIECSGGFWRSIVVAAEEFMASGFQANAIKGRAALEQAIIRCDFGKQ